MREILKSYPSIDQQRETKKKKGSSLRWNISTRKRGKSLELETRSEEETRDRWRTRDPYFPQRTDREPKDNAKEKGYINAFNIPRNRGPAEEGRKSHPESLELFQAALATTINIAPPVPNEITISGDSTSVPRGTRCTLLVHLSPNRPYVLVEVNRCANSSEGPSYVTGGPRDTHQWAQM